MSPTVTNLSNLMTLTDRYIQRATTTRPQLFKPGRIRIIGDKNQLWVHREHDFYYNMAVLKEYSGPPFLKFTSPENFNKKNPEESPPVPGTRHECYSLCRDHPNSFEWDPEEVLSVLSQFKGSSPITLIFSLDLDRLLFNYETHVSIDSYEGTQPIKNHLFAVLDPRLLKNNLINESKVHFSPEETVPLYFQNSNLTSAFWLCRISSESIQPANSTK